MAILVLPLSLLLATLLAASPSGTEGKDRARELARKATVAFNLGNYDEAASQYEAAYRLVQDPVLLYDIGQAYRLGGRPEKALAAYKGFLRTAHPGDPNRVAVEGRVADLERILRTQPAPESRPPPPAPATEPPAPTLTLPPQGPVDAPPPPPPPPPQAPPQTAPEGIPQQATPIDTTSTEAPPAEPEPPPRFRTTAGAQLGWGGRLRSGEDGVSFRGFGRLGDRGGRVYELGYLRRPIYPMNPAFQYTALYGVFRSASHWYAELGALGLGGEGHLGGGYASDVLDAGLRVERAAPGKLCGASDATLIYIVPEARLKVPVSDTFRVLATGSYRGKLITRNCPFHPSLLSIDLGAEVRLPDDWVVAGGVGHHGLFDFGPGAPDGVWPSRTNAAEQIHFEGRYLVGKISLLAQYRFITYAGGTHELVLGVEFRSTPEAP